MNNKLLLLAFAVLFVFSSCQKEMIENDGQNDVVTKSAAVDAADMDYDKVLNFRAHLSGKEQVPSNNSRATGQALFQLSSDGSELHYKLIAANILNVTMAHIHVAFAGQNGGVVVWLYPAAPPAKLIPGRFNGILAEGVITEADLRGTLAEQGLTALIDLMKEGKTYVNIHTSQFPPGEIRGQISGNAR
jgi:hypothetical protein